MISIIKNNIKTAWKTKKSFVILLVFVQIVAAFAIIFVMGAIASDYMSTKESIYSNTYIDIDIPDIEGSPVYFKNIEKMFFEIDEKFNGIYSGVGVCYVNVNSDLDVYSIWAKFSISKGKYVTNELIENEERTLMSGQTLSEEMLNSDELYAVAIVKEKLDVDTCIVEGNSINLVGNTKALGSNLLTINPATARALDRSPNLIIVALNRILTDAEYKDFIAIVDRYMGGKYENELETYSNADQEAIMKTTITMSIITAIVTVIVLFIIYNYFFTLRKKNYAIMQMAGCTRVKGSLILLGEMMLLSVPSIIIGTCIFAYCKKKWLGEIFKYLNVFVNAKVCIMFVVYEVVTVFVLFFLLSLWYSRRSIKSQLIMLEE